MRLVLVPQVLVSVGASCAGSLDWLTIGLIWWSYQPSLSSWAITTAVFFQSEVFWSRLIVSTRKRCSSRGLEYPACPSWLAGALRKLTAGMDLVSTDDQKSVRSYWWFACPEWPISDTDAGRVCCRFAVLA